MMVYIGSAGGWFPRLLADHYPGRIGHLFGPNRKMRTPLPYAIDNDRFRCFSKNIAWCADSYRRFLDYVAASNSPPTWAVVPDVVADHAATLEWWHKWAPVLRPYGWPLAFVVQNGCTPADVPAEADVVFVGGTREWKWATVQLWCSKFPRVHVGRVCSGRGLRLCYHAGAESVDGSGWFPRAKSRPVDLVRFLEEQDACEVLIPQINYDLFDAMAL